LVLNEIITTETDYVRDLAVLIGLYLRPLRDEFKDVLSSYDTKNIFKNAEALWDVHLRILQMLLQEEAEPPQQQRIGAIFIQMKEGLAKYNEYCANQQVSAETAERICKENRKFREFVEDVHQLEASNRQELQSFMVKPFQRITRYPLLLKELIKQTPADWSDKEILLQAAKEVGSVVNDANEMKRTNDTMKSLFELQDKLVVPPDHPELSHLHKFTFVMEVSGLVEITSSRKQRTKRGSLHLFGKMVLVTLHKGNKLNVQHVFNLAKTYAAFPAGMWTSCCHALL
jgi:hypothetical protein